MSRKIVISAEDFEAEATLLEDERPDTCDKMWEALPLEGEASLFKEEIYFMISEEIPPENGTKETESGDIAYWPEGPGFCIFFGDSAPVSPVNTFARTEEGSVEDFTGVDEGEKLVVRRV